MSSSNQEPIQGPITPENPASDETNRKLAMVCLAAFTLLFSLMTLLLQQTPFRIKEDRPGPPKFVTRIPEASNEEWMLLPGVGEKTASRWRADLNSKGTEQIPTLELSSPVASELPIITIPVVESLEELHGVGPLRAQKLEPYVANVAAESPARKPRKMRTQKSPNSSTSMQPKSAIKSSPHVVESLTPENPDENSTMKNVVEIKESNSGQSNE